MLILPAFGPPVAGLSGAGLVVSFIPECPSSGLEQKVALCIPESMRLQASSHLAIYPQVGHPLTHSSILFTIVGIEVGCGHRKPGRLSGKPRRMGKEGQAELSS